MAFGKEELHTRKVLEPLGWILQLLTGLLLAILITFHFFETHLIAHDALSFENVIARLTDPTHKVMYGLLLAFVTFHAFNGLRAILLDTEFGARNTRAINFSVVLIIFGAFVYGLLLLSYF
jgi:succinate dehydrogenase / fumarate reductase membrane anchor subunit